MLEEKIKNIITVYTKVPFDLINAQTVIDRSAMSSSILVHRMYAGLASEGINIENYWGIKTYSDLLERINGKMELPSRDINEHTFLNNEVMSTKDSSLSIGIDIEKINSMPAAMDFRTDDFYTMNFSSSEIAYCILQGNPVASFAGLFAAKEAIVKADNEYINKPFNTIVIDHLPGGKPIHPDFQISISHTSSLAIAIAIKDTTWFSRQNNSLSTPSLPGNQKSNFILYLICVIAFIASVVAIILHFS